jgi:hypothetical protein
MQELVELGNKVARLQEPRCLGYWERNSNGRIKPVTEDNWMTHPCFGVVALIFVEGSDELTGFFGLRVLRQVYLLYDFAPRRRLLIRDNQRTIRSLVNVIFLGLP